MNIIFVVFQKYSDGRDTLCCIFSNEEAANRYIKEAKRTHPEEDFYYDRWKIHEEYPY